MRTNPLESDMTNTIRNADTNVLAAVSALLVSRGFDVGGVVVPEIFAVDGNPYFSTSATLRDIYEARRDVRKSGF